MQHLPDTALDLCLERVQCLGSWRFFAPGGVCASACVRACVLSRGARLLLDALVGCSQESHGANEKVQDAVAPDGKYDALVGGAAVSPLTVAFRPNRTLSGEDEPATHGDCRAGDRPPEWTLS